MIKTSNMIQDIMDKNWVKNYEMLKYYFDKYGPVCIKGDKSTTLGIWVKNQRQLRSTMSQERRQLLDDIKFPWKI